MNFFTKFEIFDLNPFQKIKTHIRQMNTIGDTVNIATSDEVDEFLDEADWVGSLSSGDSDKSFTFVTWNL